MHGLSMLVQALVSILFLVAGMRISKPHQYRPAPLSYLLFRVHVPSLELSTLPSMVITYQWQK